MITTIANDHVAPFFSSVSLRHFFLAPIGPQCRHILKSAQFDIPIGVKEALRTFSYLFP